MALASISTLRALSRRRLFSASSPRNQRNPYSRPTSWLVKWLHCFASASLKMRPGSCHSPIQCGLAPRPPLAIALRGIERRARFAHQTEDRGMRDAIVIHDERQIVEGLEGLPEGVSFAARNIVAVVVGLRRWQRR